MAETAKKPNTIKSIGKKVANNGNADDYVYVPIGADSDNVDRPDGSTVEESLLNIETGKVEIIPVEVLPTTDIKVYPFIYALVKPSESKGIFYEYRDDKWIKYGNGAKGIWVGTKEECAKEFDNIEAGTIVIIVKKDEESGDTHTHDYVEYVTKAPTYSESGIKTCTCFLCGESHTEEIPALFDSVKPAGVIRIGNNEYATWKDTVTFDTYYKDNQTVTMEASDNETGIKEIVYHLANTSLSASNIESVTWTPYTDPFTLEPNNNFIVYVKITDNSGNVTYICSDGIVMDNIPPVFEGLEDGGTYPTGTVLTVEDGTTLTVDGVAVELVNNTYTFTEPKDNIQLSLIDKAGNSSIINIVINLEEPAEAPIDAHLNWVYTLDDSDKTITLSRYNGNDTDLTVYASYSVNGKTYKTKFIENYGSAPYVGLFNNKNNVKSIKFNNIDTSINEYMSYMFYNCSSLETLDISNFDTSNVVSMRAMFSGCSSLETLDIRNFNMNKIVDESFMFSDCANLKTIIVSNNNWKYGYSIDKMFENCGTQEVTYV